MTDPKQAIDRSKAGGGAPGAAAGGAEERSRHGQAPAPAGVAVKPSAEAPLRAREGSPADTAGVIGEESQDGLSGGGDAEIQGDLDELVAVADQRDEYLALAQRTQADFENYRKRMARESALAQERGVGRLAKELLPALDSLDRALAGADQDDPLLDGVRLVRSELTSALARVGVESFSPLGESFDPAVHEAMATIEQPANGAASGTVVEVYQPGYRLGASIIRPARVVVAA